MATEEESLFFGDMAVHALVDTPIRLWVLPHSRPTGLLTILHTEATGGQEAAPSTSLLYSFKAVFL